MIKNTSIFLLLCFSNLLANATDGYSVQSCNMKIAGTSSVHDFIIHCGQVSGSGTILLESNSKIKEIRSIMLNVNAASLKSERKSKTMDRKMYEALKTNLYPTISFNLTKILAYPSAANGNTLAAVGTMTIAGVSKEENFTLSTKINSNGTITFAGEKKLYMTQYNMVPPVAMFGALTVDNEVTLSFELTMNKTY